MFYINKNQLANLYCEKIGWLLHQQKDSFKGLQDKAMLGLFVTCHNSITSSVTP